MLAPRVYSLEEGIRNVDKKCRNHNLLITEKNVAFFTESSSANVLWNNGNKFYCFCHIKY